MSQTRWVAVLCAAVMCGASYAIANELPIRGIVYDESRVRTPEVFVGPEALVGHVPSERNILGLDRAHRFGMPTAASAARQKTVNVAVLRVQFPLEVPDDPRTTGNGNIDLRDSTVFFAEEGHQFETAPHNKDFFETVMRAMAQYYSVVSNGRLTVAYDVYPNLLDSAYTLDSSMCYYGQLPPNEGLAYLLQDAVVKADTDPDITFGNYDAFILFHAGSDQQHNFSSLTPTPCDLYTAFVRLLDTALFVPVDGGTFFVEEGVILPETATQDNRGTGLNGVTAHEFGHALGLPDIYSTRTGTTQTGDFSLMDNNAQQVGVQFGVPWEITTFFDLLPVFPNAWSRSYLGFTDLVVVTPDSILARDHVDPDSVVPYLVTVAEGSIPFNQVLQIPINSREYFLAEFRSPDQDLNANSSIPGDQGVGIRFDSTFNAVLGPATCNPSTQAEVDSCRVLGRDYDFQFFQAGETGGLLVWHVDEEVAYQSVPVVEADPFLINNYQANTLQWDRFRRFLEIEEADGLVDFGGNYFTYFGGQQELFVGGGNNQFGLSTNPSTRGHSGAPTGLDLFDISPVYPPNTSPDNLPLHHMKVKIRRKSAVAGWPQAAGSSPAPGLTVIGGPGTDTILTVSGPYVLGWNADGTPLINQLPGDSAYTVMTRFDGTADTITLTGFARAGATLVTAPSVGTDQSTGVRYVSAVDTTGRVYIWSFDDLNADGWADSVDAYNLSAPAPRAPAWYDRDGDGDAEMFVASVTGSGALYEDGSWNAMLLGAVVRDWAWVAPQGHVYVSSDDGLRRIEAPANVTYTSLGRQFQSLVAIDSDRDDNDELFARDTRQLHHIDISGSPNILTQKDPRFDFHGALSSGDHDNNGVPSVLCGAGEWQTGFQPNLSLETNYPLRGNDFYSADPVSEAIIVDDAIFFGGADGEVHGTRRDGSRVDGFPFLAGDTVTSIASVRSGTDSIVLLARSTNGYVWGTLAEAPGDAPGSWSQSRADAAKTNRWDGTGTAAPSPGTGTQTLEKVFAYPNPARQGMVTIRYTLDESSEVEVSIYDLAGNEVTKASTSGFGGLDNEWIWDASSIAPGVYFCRVQAMQAGKEVVEFCKVAITP